MQIVTLITGLDGSGKSTLLKRLANDDSNNVDIIYVPHIEISSIPDNSELIQAATFINWLSKEADVIKIPQLKAVALFASMIVFKQLLKNKTKKNIFCERHPLIDSRIYAQFYATKMTPGSISSSVLKELDNNYGKELSYVLELLPKGLLQIEGGITESFISFIYNWFHIKKMYSIKDLFKLFEINLPDQIIYLQADPEILFQRIKKREVLEAHESVEVFALLNDAYLQLFRHLLQIPVSIEIVDANSAVNLDNLYSKIKSKL